MRAAGTETGTAGAAADAAGAAGAAGGTAGSTGAGTSGLVIGAVPAASASWHVAREITSKLS